MPTMHSELSVTAAGQSQRSEEQCNELKAEIKLLKQDLHTSQKEFILACINFFVVGRQEGWAAGRASGL